MHNHQETQSGKSYQFSEFRWTAENKVQHSCRVYTPPNFSKERKYRILYLLPGRGDTQVDWHDTKGEKGHLHKDIKELEADGTIEPMIIVMPIGRPAGIDPILRLGFPKADEFQKYFLELMDAIEGEYQNSLVT